MKILLLLVALAVVALLVYEAWARRRDRRDWPAPGRMVDVGGHRLHARVWGEGDVTVVLEADEGAWSTHWGAVPERLSSDARVLSYDRAGLGWSDAGPPPRDVETVARELHQLLAHVAGEPRRVVLVGHGYGAHVLRVYAHRYPFEIAGLVFVNGAHEDLGDRLRREQVPAPPAPSVGSRLDTVLARLGVHRLMARRRSPNAHLPLPERQRALLDALELDPRVRSAVAQELAAEARTHEQVARATTTHAVPARVLTCLETLGPDGVPASYPRDEFNRAWVAQNATLAAVSTRSETIELEGDHLLPMRDPDAVVAAVRAVLEDSRQPVEE